MIHFNCLVLTIYSTSNQRQECFVVTTINNHLHAFYRHIPIQGPSVNVFCGLNVAILLFQEIYIPPLLFIQRCECILVWGKLYIIVYNLVIAYFAPNIDRYFRQKKRVGKLQIQLWNLHGGSEDCNKKWLLHTDWLFRALRHVRPPLRVREDFAKENSSNLIKPGQTWQNLVKLV